MLPYSRYPQTHVDLAGIAFNLLWFLDVVFGNSSEQTILQNKGLPYFNLWCFIEVQQIKMSKQLIVIHTLLGFAMQTAQCHLKFHQIRSFCMKRKIGCFKYIYIYIYTLYG